MAWIPASSQQSEPSSVTGTEAEAPRRRSRVDYGNELEESPPSEKEEMWVQSGPPSDYPQLDFKPTLLRTGSLFGILAFLLACLAANIILLCITRKNGSIHSSITAYHFALRFTPAIVGTVTKLLWQALVQNVRRITPYILMASNSLLKPNWRSTLGAIDSPGYKHFAPWPVKALSLTVKVMVLIIPFKSVLLSTTPVEDGWETRVSVPVVSVLIFTYAMLSLSTLALIIVLRNRRTGLKWDPVSIADHLVLLRRSDVLDDFRGLETTVDRGQVHNAMKDRAYRLGYWRKGQEVWHGIGREGPLSSSEWSESIEPVVYFNEHENPVQNAAADMEEQSRGTIEPTKLGSEVPSLLTVPAMRKWTFIALAAACGIVFLLSTDDLHEGIHIHHMSQYLARFLFRALLTFIAQFYRTIWDNASKFHCEIQPFASMYPIAKPASENLLVDYVNTPPIIVSLKAASKGHWKVAYFSLLALASNAFPILVAALFVVFPVGTGVTIVVALPTFYGVSLFVFIYCISLPLAWPTKQRKVLPRHICCIGELITYCYGSQLLQDPKFLLALNRPTDTRKHLECKLFLSEDKYIFTDRGDSSGRRVGFDVV